MNKNMYVGLGRQLKEAKAILAEEYVPIDCSPPCTQTLPEENFPEVILLATLGVRKCHGCKGQIIKKIASPQRFGFLHAGSSNIEIESTNSLAKTLWKYLFSLDNFMCSVTQPNNNH